MALSAPTGPERKAPMPRPLGVGARKLSPETLGTAPGARGAALKGSDRCGDLKDNFEEKTKRNHFHSFPIDFNSIHFNSNVNSCKLQGRVKKSSSGRLCAAQGPSEL